MTRPTPLKFELARTPIGRAVTGEQKEAVIDALRTAWAAHPEWRLGQLIINCAGDHSVFYVEDEVLEAALRNEGRR